MVNPPQRLRILKSEDGGFCVTVEIVDEDHTLGNALRYILTKNETVKFCGYSIPHPTDRKVAMQIQTYPEKGVTGMQAFEQGLKDLLDLSEAVKQRFKEKISSSIE